MNFETTDSPGKADIDALIEGLTEYNSAAVPRDRQELGVFVRSAGTLLAGAYGASIWDWVHIRFLWVHPDHRNSGLGTQVMQRVEQEAARRGCVGIHLDTYSFQALPFYQKLGFEVFGEVEGHPKGHTRHFLKKRVE